MKTIIEGLREIVGAAEFYNTDSSYSGSWDYGAMIEYFCAVLILIVVITSVFRFLGRMFK